jgi:plastocyanin
MNSKITVAVSLVAVLAAVLVSASFSPAFAANTAVSVTTGASSKTTNAFSPNPVNVKVGDTVIWTNNDSQPHTVTSGSDGTPDKKFDSSPNFQPLLAPKQTFSFKFTEEGKYPYYCGLHPNMMGVVNVAASDGGGNNTDGGLMQTKVTAKTVDGKSFEIMSKSMTSKVTAATINEGKKSVTVTFDKSGDVELTLPKVLISGISSVTAGGQNVKFTPTNSTDLTTLQFTVPNGSTSVDILGASVVPEFPVFAAIILAGSIIAIIGYTRFAGNSRVGFHGRA